MGDVAGMKRCAVDMGAGDIRFEADDEFDAGRCLFGVEGEQEVFVAGELCADEIDGGHWSRLYDGREAMPIPERMQVKLSSEAAEYVSLTPVVVQEMNAGELLEQILGVTGADAARAREVLKRGSLVSGASRYRWVGIECEAAEVEALMAKLPGPEPGRRFAAERCVRVVLSGGGARLEISRAAAMEKRLLKRTSFWEALMAEASDVEYAGYLYRERADRYVCALSEEAVGRIRASAGLLKYEGLARQAAAGAWLKAEWVSAR